MRQGNGKLWHVLESRRRFEVAQTALDNACGRILFGNDSVNLAVSGSSIPGIKCKNSFVCPDTSASARLPGESRQMACESLNWKWLRACFAVCCRCFAVVLRASPNESIHCVICAENTGNKTGVVRDWIPDRRRVSRASPARPHGPWRSWRSRSAVSELLLLVLTRAVSFTHCRTSPHQDSHAVQALWKEVFPQAKDDLLVLRIPGLEDQEV